MTLPGLLRLELIQLSLLPIDLGLLRRHPPLQVFILFLPRLHLVADERASNESYGRADASTGPGVAGGAADDRT
ncbi:MAG TPA: hypothetical protein VNT76_07700 [Candidatus Binatus sp.]|nr:hypothetical protein [Candidatus Binatus sp.]